MCSKYLPNYIQQKMDIEFYNFLIKNSDDMEYNSEKLIVEDEKIKTN